MSDFIKKILWTTDFSDEAQEALLYAHAFAKTFRAKIAALHVVPGFSSAVMEAAVPVREALTRRLVALKKEADSRLDRVKSARKVRFKPVVKDGNAAKRIIETAEEEKADLIVMGRRGESAIEKLFIGSVANQVLRHASVPVLLTKKKSGAPRFDKILVPTDFSEQEERERDFAVRLARGFGSEITLLHVLELHGYEFPPKILDEMFDAVREKLLDRKKRQKGIRVSEDVTRAVNAASGIVDYAETHGMDLIVISTCVHSWLERFFLGSTTEKVISYSSVPVFAIPPSQCAR
ncbi:MAG: universal stress protein [Candidatus Aminicenantales bacterium]